MGVSFATASAEPRAGQAQIKWAFSGETRHRLEGSNRSKKWANLRPVGRLRSTVRLANARLETARPILRQDVKQVTHGSGLRRYE